MFFLETQAQCQQYLTTGVLYFRYSGSTLKYSILHSVFHFALHFHERIEILFIRRELICQIRIEHRTTVTYTQSIVAQRLCIGKIRIGLNGI